MSLPERPIRPWPRVRPLQRYGPVVLIAAALAAAGVVSTLREAGNAPAGPASPGPPGASTTVPPTYPAAAREGRTADYRWEPRCDPATGRVKVPSIYALPCVPAFSGRNGGSTWNGVSRTSVNVVYYEPPSGGGLAAAIEGTTGTPAQRLATARGYAAMLNHVAEMYGRHVTLIPFQASGSGSDPVAARANAVTVAQQLHAFASIGGPLQTEAYQDELAREHVMCLGCGVSAPLPEVRRDAPYLWGDSPTPETLLDAAASFVIHQLSGQDAAWAGDPAWHRRRRSFAVVSYVQNPPVSDASTEMTQRLTAAHVPLAISEPLTYQLDLTTLTDQAATIAAKLRASGATTVVFAGDPIMPIYLTRACAAIGYFPEWVVTGTAYTDTTTLGRFYDQAEWAHAFGISALAVPTPVPEDDAYRLYRWWYGSQASPPASKNAAMVLPPLVQLFEGIQLAGPRLTPFTFAAGLFRAPPAGGAPTAPLEAFGSQGAPPAPSYTSPADYTFIWYDAAGKGASEQGTAGTGVIRYVDGGRRYRDGTGPSGTIPMFSRPGSVTGYPAPPHGARPPSYPPWPGSPAAGS